MTPDELELDNSFTEALPADPSTENRPRQVTGAAFSRVTPAHTEAPVLLSTSGEMLDVLGIDGHRLARLPMAGVGFDDLGHLQPMFEQLRRQFDEIARHRSSGDGFIRHLGQHPVQGVAEFVKQRARIVP